MSTTVAINGFGRIGRDFLRLVLDSGELEVAAINDVTDCATLARLLRHDSTFGVALRVPVVDGSLVDLTALLAFDAPLTQVSGRMVKVFGWYDNEWGYTAQLADLACLVASTPS